ncbi:MAG: T9SS type A sorting domain-containing protein [Flavobacteriales bacterium]|nr:T9SS type A sorting domain-containing protein [Flavobacteriales bacterium]MBK7241332.1 T9SS type A sorting domain-containing protein [Flavobacteriales bacterium]HQX31105.1 T9SS type A sorting domain-containing protein [Flavobacteriales bacterium]
MNVIPTFSNALLSVAVLFAFGVQAQVQLGNDIDGEAEGDRSGRVVSMPDLYTVAIGASGNSDAGSDAGHVRVYAWISGSWVQKGADIDGPAIADNDGWSVSMPNPDMVAIGATEYNLLGTRPGHVRIFEWSGSAWLQKGSTLLGEGLGDGFGGQVSMPDAFTVAIGATFNDGNGANAGHVRIYTWNGMDWEQKGTDIDGEAAGDNAGWDVCMPDANTVAIGAPYNDGAATNAGHARIFEWDGSAWIQKGSAIEGEATFTGWGARLAMPSANTLAVGSAYDDTNGTNAGSVRIYDWNGTSWVEKGNGIFGEAEDDLMGGGGISMPNANTIAIGTGNNDGNGSDAGHVRIFQYNGSAWVQAGVDIDGEATGDRSGDLAISMPDLNTVAIGGMYNDGNGSNSGHVRVYSLSTITSMDNTFGTTTSIQPNPTNGMLTINLGTYNTPVRVTLRDAQGRALNTTTYNNVQPITLPIEGVPGIYFVELHNQNNTITRMVLKQ